MSVKPGFVEEVPLTPESQLAIELNEWVPRAGYEWLGEALFESGCLPRDSLVADLARQLCSNVFRRWSRFDDRDRTILHFIEGLQQSITGYPNHHWTVEPAAVLRLARAASACGVDFTGALRTETEDPSEERGPDHMLGLLYAVNTARLLHEYGVLEPERLCDLDRLRELGRRGLWHSSSVSGPSPQEELTDVASPTFWLVVGNEPFWRCVGPQLEAGDDEEASVLARGIAHLRIRLGSGHTPYDYAEGGKIVHRVFEELDRRIGDSPRHAPDALRETWLALSLELNSPMLGGLNEGVQQRLRAAADFELGRLRADLKSAKEHDAADWFVSQLTLLETAASIMFLLSPVWDGMRPLLLLFRQLPEVALTPDMRYWSDRRNARSQPPEPWCHVPEKLVGQLQSLVGDEQEGDPELTALRTKFGRFCLSRLKSKKGGASPVEPNENWRWAYISVCPRAADQSGGPGPPSVASRRRERRRRRGPIGGPRRVRGGAAQLQARHLSPARGDKRSGLALPGPLHFSRAGREAD